MILPLLLRPQYRHPRTATTVLTWRLRSKALQAVVVKSGAYKLQYACRLNILPHAGANTSKKVRNRAVGNATLTDGLLGG